MTAPLGQFVAQRLEAPSMRASLGLDAGEGADDGGVLLVAASARLGSSANFVVGEPFGKILRLSNTV